MGLNVKPARCPFLVDVNLQQVATRSSRHLLKIEYEKSSDQPVTWEELQQGNGLSFWPYQKSTNSAADPICMSGDGTEPILRRPTSYPLLSSLTHYQERRKRGLDVRIRCGTPSGKYQAKVSELQFQGG